MKYQKLNLVRFLYLSFLSFFGLGFSPKAPGTVGSIGAVGLIVFLDFLGVSFFTLISFTIILFILSCFIAHYAQIKEEIHDPGWIVIDEVLGMLVTWMFIFPKVDPFSLFLLFIIFRFFDIIKIFPINWLDKKIKNGAGTIIDDVMAALYAGALLKFVIYFTSEF